YRLAADQGHADAQFNLGVWHVDGQRAPQDYTEAMRWYRLAADQGHADAQFNLGVMHINGQGVPQDYITMHMWFNLAAVNGNDRAAKNRSIVASQMTADAIAEAQRRARLCIDSNYQDCD
ncbi:tetratricopeptide repeat protein, partial [Streptomyces murinus]|uniref:tetratricopeptide repeat protein n=1 Tax=Streptomyces murinus TaxID=33900 RepID=UPI0031DB9C8A